jgi:hypothetical protein
VIALAAIGITRHAWRSDWNGYVEDAHTVAASRRRTRIIDGEMFAANAATTRFVLEHLSSYPDVDWEELADAFIDPNRIAGRRTLVDLLGTTRHSRWARWAWKYITTVGWMVTNYGPEYTLILQANEGTRCDYWWAGPNWSELVEVASHFRCKCGLM